MEQQKVAQMRQKIAEVLESEERVLFAYIFGSTATGTERKGSDVDVALYLVPESAEGSFDIRLELMEKLTRAISKDVDVVVLNAASPFLRYVALKEGQLVLERAQGARIDFELKALNEYFDYKPIMEMYHNRLRAFA